MGISKVAAGIAAVTLLMSGWSVTAARADEPAGDSQSAVWTPKELWFVYQGFTTRYSCDGLRDKVREVLLQLGARKKDLQVIETGCSASPGRPDPFPGVRIRMNVLAPPNGATAAAESLVPAHWQPVDLKVHDYGYVNDSGHCELVEQVRQKILPLFTTRNVELRSNCVPHQASPTGPSLKLEALAADPVPGGPADSARDRSPSAR